MTKPLTNATDVKREFAHSPRLLESWLMVGYRQWWKRKFGTHKITSTERKLDKELSNLSLEEWQKLKSAVRKKLR